MLSDQNILILITKKCRSPTIKTNYFREGEKEKARFFKTFLWKHYDLE